MGLPKYEILIGGNWHAAAGGDYFETCNPYTAKPWALIPRCGTADAERAIDEAHAAFESGSWPRMTATQRGALLRRLGDLLAQHADTLAQTEVRDNGKLIAEMGAQTRYVPQWYYYYGGTAHESNGGGTTHDKSGWVKFLSR